MRTNPAGDDATHTGSVDDDATHVGIAHLGVADAGAPPKARPVRAQGQGQPSRGAQRKRAALQVLFPAPGDRLV